MPPRGSAKRSEDLIKSALLYGRKQQNELVKLVNRSETTVRGHLKKLVEDGEIQKSKEGRKVFYYLNNDRKDIIRVKPYANDREIEYLLDTISRKVDITLSRDNSKRSIDFAELQTEIYDNVDEDILHTVIQFREKCSNEYHVLSNDENLEKAIAIFEEIIHTFDKQKSSGIEIPWLGWAPGVMKNKEHDHLTFPSEIYTIFIAGISSLEHNWSKGMEHEDFHREIDSLSEDIIQNSPRMPESFLPELSIILLQHDPDKAQEMFRRIVQHGDHSVETWREVSKLIFDQHNNLNRLFEILEEIEAVENNTNEDKIKRLKEKIRGDYR